MAHDVTKYGIHSNYRIPPESSGDRILHSTWYVLEVAGLDSANLRSLPATITDNAGVEGFVVHSTDILNSLSKRLTVILRDVSMHHIESGTILTIDGGEHPDVDCTVIAAHIVNAPAAQISGGNDPNNLMSVDKFGSAYMRFTEGAQQLDPMGLTRMSTPYAVLDIKFLTNTNDNIAFGKATGTASQTFLLNERVLAVDIGTAAGDKFVKQSNRKAFFQSGFSTIVDLPYACGDSGKLDVVRRWGYFDDKDGLFFELDGTQLSFVIRTSTHGVVDGEVYNERRIWQAEWRGDTLDGTNGKSNPSYLTLHPEMMNNYFIDFSDNAAGHVRFGIYGPNGRIVCHDEFIGNVVHTNFMRSGSLPLRWEMFNKAGVSSPSRFKTVGGTVLNEGFLTPDSNIMTGNPATYVMPTLKTITGGAYTPLITARASKTLADGTTLNKNTIVPSKLVYHVEGGPIVLQVRVGMVLLDAVFTRSGSSTIELDTTAAFPSNPMYQGLPLMSRVYGVGSYTVDPPDTFNIRGNGLSLRSDGEYGLAYTWVVRPVNPEDTVKVMFGADWIDI